MPSDTNEPDSVRQARQSFNAALQSPDFETIHGDDAQLRFMIDRLEPVAGGRYLDLATGTGYAAFALAERVPECSVIGVDIADEAIAANAEAAADRGLANVTFQVVDGTALPFADHSFDGVICRYAVHHFPDPTATLADVYRVLKPGGRFVVADAVKNDGDTADFVNAFQALKPDGHIRMYTPGEFTKLLADSGFEEKQRQMSDITFTRTLDAAYRELIAKTPAEIAERYLLDIKDDEAVVRFDIVSLALRKAG